MSDETEKPQGPDWVGAKAAYCAATMSIPRICQIYKVSRSALLKRAEEEAWERNLQGALLTEVRNRIASGIRDEDLEPYVKAQADVIAKVHESHRGTARTLHDIVSSVAEVMHQTIDAIRGGDPDPEVVQELPLAFRLITGKLGIVGAIESLASSAQRITEMEIRLHGLDKLNPPEKAEIQVAGGGASIAIYIPDNGRDVKPRDPPVVLEE